MAEDDEDYSLTEEEYLRWYLPREALAHVAKQLEDSDARALILKRIADEDLFTAVRKLIVTSSYREREPRYFERLSKKRWADAPALLSHPFWRTNDIVFKGRTSTLSSPPTTYSCVEVRFDPEGVERLLPAPSTRRQERTAEAINQMVETVSPSIERWAASMATATQPAPSMGAPTNYLSESEVNAWAASLSPADRNRSFRWLWKTVRETYTPRQVYKKHVLPLVEGRDKGRPRKNVPGNVPAQ